MTCILAIKTKSGFIMGADSVGTDMETYGSITTPKIFRLKDFIIGYTSSFRFGKLLQYSLDIPMHDNVFTDDEYINGDFANAIRKCLSVGGFSTIKDNEETGGYALIGYHGKVWGLQSEFSLVEYTKDVIAAGSGDVAALAAAKALLKYSDLTKKEIVYETLKIVEETILTVKGPFEILEGFFPTEEENKNES